MRFCFPSLQYAVWKLYLNLLSFQVNPFPVIVVWKLTRDCWNWRLIIFEDVDKFQVHICAPFFSVSLFPYLTTAVITRRRGGLWSNGNLEGAWSEGHESNQEVYYDYISLVKLASYFEVDAKIFGLHRRKWLEVWIKTKLYAGCTTQNEIKNDVCWLSKICNLIN